MYRKDNNSEQRMVYHVIQMWSAAQVVLDEIYNIQTFIKPTDVQINLEAKSLPGGQNGLIWNKDQIFYQIEPFLIPIHLQICMTECTLDYIE
jgi:hypothetical protein